MLRKRLIPCLLMQNQGLYKTQKFSGGKYVGDPINAIRIFNEKEVDELILLDIGVSKQNQPLNFRMIEQIASECFMPLTYGGGIRSLDDVKTLFSLGVEKVSLQTSVFNNVNLIRQIADCFGSQSVVVSLDMKKTWLGKQAVFFSSKSKIFSTHWQQHLSGLVEAGAGEILLNSVDRDGMMNGLDCSLIKEVVEKVSIPVIACGGVGSLTDIISGYRAGASAVAVGSYFVFHGEHRAVLITYPSPTEMEKLFEELS